MLFAKALKFGCNLCGECCRQMRVPINHEDISRIRRARPELPPEQWLQLHPVSTQDPDAVWIGGRPVLLLLKILPPENSCVFLQDNACGLYENRPGVCRIWPFERAGRHLQIAPPHRLLVSLSCEQTPFRGEQEIRQAMDVSDPAFLRYRQLITQWNQEQETHPERQSLADLLAFLEHMEAAYVDAHRR